MDEAGAALDALQPQVAVTYAEAGGWGRALALECRRRGVPLAGVQHGFIYRHWLNYRHEPDEMAPDPGNPQDHGFPAPALTLLFDDHARRHLETAGRFPPDLLAVTGSARLDELVQTVRELPAPALAEARAAAGATDRRLVVFAGKEREARRVLPPLVAAIRGMSGVQLAIKPHPAETAEVYAGYRGDAVTVLAPDSALAPVLAAADLLVTVNSTVAIDALALDLPSLIIGLPNNLSPFVDAGVMAGAATEPEIRTEIAKLLYNQEFRATLLRRANTASPDGQAAARAARALLDLGGLAASTTRTPEER